MKLYELTSDLIELESLNLDDDSLADTLEAVSGEFNDKAVAILKFTENMSGDIRCLSSEIKRLQERKKVIENRKAKLRDYLLYNMEKSGVTKIECPFFTASIRKGSESVEIENSELLPDEYVTVEVVEKADKNAIKRDLRAGKEISGAKLVRGANTIIIK